MAVGAYDLALRDLRNERGQRALAAAEIAHVGCFPAEVVEFQDVRVGCPAVAAARSGKHAANVVLVSTPRYPLLSWEAPLEGDPLKGAPAVTVCADDVALGDLQGEPRGRRPATQESRNIRGLRMQMIELEDDDVLGAAVRARVGAQVGQDVGASSLTKVGDPRSSALTVFALVGREASPTPRLPPGTTPAEQDGWQQQPTPAAAMHEAVRPQRVAGQGLRFARPGNRLPRRFDISDPDADGTEPASHLGGDAPQAPAVFS